jgi:hypothetical protein
MAAELSGEWPPAKAFGAGRTGPRRETRPSPSLKGAGRLQREKLTVIGGIVFVTAFPSRSSPGV